MISFGQSVCIIQYRNCGIAIINLIHLLVRSISMIGKLQKDCLMLTLFKAILQKITKIINPTQSFPLFLIYMNEILNKRTIFAYK